MVDTHMGDLTREEKQWAMFIHLSSFLGYITGIGFILGPLVLWLIKKDTSQFIDQNGKEAVNFQISLLIYSIVSFILSLIIIGFLLLFAIAILQIIYAIVCAIRAKDGILPRYPLTIRFIK